MKFVSVLAAAALATSVAASARAATPAVQPPAASGPPTVAELTAEGRIHGVEVSPSGRYLAIIRHTDARDFIQVIDLTARAQSVITPEAKAVSFAITEVHWKTEDRLVYTYIRSGWEDYDRGQNKRTVMMTRWGLASVGRDGSQPTKLPGYGIVDWLDSDPGRLIALSYGERVVGEAIQAESVDLASATSTVLDLGGANTLGWAADRTGGLVLRYDRIGRKGGLKVQKRGPDGTWTELFAIREKDVRAMPDFEVMGAAADPSKLYVAVKPEPGGEGDTRELRLYDVVARTMGPKIWSISGYDFEVAGFDEKTGEPASLCYWADVLRCELRDADKRRDYEAMIERFGPGKSIGMHSSSTDGNIQVVFVQGPTDPGSFHVYDRKTGKVEALGNQRPSLKGDRLAPTTRVEWKSRDGLALSGYLTVPKTAASGPPPLVVMPHGGPEARDNLHFDRWAQAFAARGYAVFQPNFRGSGGFGSRFAAMGYGQWGLRMQDDVMDGVQSLLDQGKADPARVCIVGASYGGYVALYAGARAPERFKCVVSFAGVSDLVAIQKWERSERGADSPVYAYWLKSIGDPEKDRDRLVATSPITYAAQYQPPVLMIHGKQDDIVPISQSRAMESALRKAGRSVKLTEVPMEGHSGWSSEEEAKALTEMLDFVDKAIGAKPQPAAR